MIGVIRARHLMTHARIIVREFGLRAYLRCLVRALRDPSRTTFLRGIR
jgi:hypothetical protein